jgi:hypothetical protein
MSRALCGIPPTCRRWRGCARVCASVCWTHHFVTPFVLQVTSNKPFAACGATGVVDKA